MTMIKYSDTVSTAPVAAPKPVVDDVKQAKVDGNEQTSPNSVTTKVIKNRPNP